MNSFAAPLRDDSGSGAGSSGSDDFGLLSGPERQRLRRLAFAAGIGAEGLGALEEWAQRARLDAELLELLLAGRLVPRRRPSGRLDFDLVPDASY